MKKSKGLRSIAAGESDLSEGIVYLIEEVDIFFIVEHFFKLFGGAAALNFGVDGDFLHLSVKAHFVAVSFFRHGGELPARLRQVAGDFV